MVLSQLKTHKLLTIIARIVGVKINRKIADMLFDVFSEGTSSERNIITIKVDGRDISFLDHVITLNNDEIRKLKLYLIKRIVDVREWPGLAIRKWATYHLKVNDDSMRYIYRSSLPYNRKSLVNALQEHHTYNAGKSKHRIDITELRTTNIVGIDEITTAVDYKYLYNDQAGGYEHRELPHVEEEDDIQF